MKVILKITVKINYLPPADPRRTKAPDEAEQKEPKLFLLLLGLSYLFAGLSYLFAGQSLDGAEEGPEKPNEVSKVRREKSHPGLGYTLFLPCIVNPML